MSGIMMGYMAAAINTEITTGSLQFIQAESDYLVTPASSDWNLGTTWTIEFWLNMLYTSIGHAPGGIWGLINQQGWTANNSINIAISDAKLVVGQGPTYNDVRYTEPTPTQWTQVAIVNAAGTQKVFYNGIEQTKVSGTFDTASYTNNIDDLYIGRLAPGYGSFIDGKMAMIRISNTAKYSTDFTPSTTYGVEADTVLFLGQSSPLVDTSSSAHVITNNGVTIDADFPA